jgi:hypothetical protein
MNRQKLERAIKTAEELARIGKQYINYEDRYYAAELELAQAMRDLRLGRDK